MLSNISIFVTFDNIFVLLTSELHVIYVVTMWFMFQISTQIPLCEIILSFNKL
jgi:hypothetical protein